MILKELKEVKHDAKLLDGTPSLPATWQSPIILSCSTLFILVGVNTYCYVLKLLLLRTKRDTLMNDEYICEKGNFRSST